MNRKQSDQDLQAVIAAMTASAIGEPSNTPDSGFTEVVLNVDGRKIHYMLVSSSENRELGSKTLTKRLLPDPVLGCELWTGTVDDFFQHHGRTTRKVNLPALPISWSAYNTASREAMAADLVSHKVFDTHEDPATASVSPGEAARILNVPVRIVQDFVRDGKLRLTDTGIRKIDVTHLRSERRAAARAALDRLEEWGVGRDCD